MDCALEIKKFMNEKNINIASFVRDLKKANPDDLFAKKLTQQKLYLSFAKKRPLRLEELVLIIVQLKKQYPEVSADMFININSIKNN